MGSSRCLPCHWRGVLAWGICCMAGAWRQTRSVWGATYACQVTAGSLSSEVLLQDPTQALAKTCSLARSHLGYGFGCAFGMSLWCCLRIHVCVEAGCKFERSRLQCNVWLRPEL